VSGGACEWGMGGRDCGRVMCGTCGCGTAGGREGGQVGKVIYRYSKGCQCGGLWERERERERGCKQGGPGGKGAGVPTCKGDRRERSHISNSAINAYCEVETEMEHSAQLLSLCKGAKES
jgi:hypothetical protein